jgi:ribokinase
MLESDTGSQTGNRSLEWVREVALARITVIGSLNMDLVVRTPRIPKPGETIIGRDFHTIPGGKGANQAVAAAKLQAEVSMVGCVGPDDFGQALLNNLATVGINTDYVRRHPSAASGIALITVEDSGQNNIVLASGANMALSAEDIDAAEERIASSAMVLCQLESPLPTIEHALKVAKRRGVTTVLNPAPAQPLSQELLSYVDFLVPNETETSLLTGLPVETPAQVEAAAQQLRRMGVGTIILTLGERGAFLASAQGNELVPGYKVQPVDTTAAGDAFVGGFAVALAEGSPLAEAVRRGNAAGALSVTKLGAQPSMPSRQEWDAFYRQ